MNLRAAVMGLANGIVAVAGSACGRGAAASGRTATIGIHYSHYSVSEVTAKAGEPITITLRNDDPIDHEWIVGTDAVHERHRTGTERYHGSVPTEVTIPPYTTKVTTVIFRVPGDYKYICHLPGHEQYGMVGVLHVVD